MTIFFVCVFFLFCARSLNMLVASLLLIFSYHSYHTFAKSSRRTSLFLLPLFSRLRSSRLHYYSNAPIWFLGRAVTADGSFHVIFRMLQECFKKAMTMVGEEFLDRVLYYKTAWLPARVIVEEAVKNRLQVNFITH